MSLQKLDLIWNMSLICPWDCQFCCVDAVHVEKSRNSVALRELGLSHKRILHINNIDYPQSSLERLKALGIKPNIFDLALQDRQTRKLELSYEQKINVLHNILPLSAEIDFSGGDPLACYENFLIIKEAKKLFGKQNISITSTGATLSRYSLSDIASTIGKFEFTFDEPVTIEPVNRPLGYNTSNLTIAKKLSKFNLKTKAQVPLHCGNLEVERTHLLYNALHSAEVDEVLLMRVFPVGRGYKNYSNKILRDDYLRAINEFRVLENRLTYPKVKLQCALKHLDKNENTENPCDLMHHSFGITPKGMLLMSAWAVNSIGEPLDEAFVLGSLSEKSFEFLLTTDIAQEYLSQLDNNWGHCKIFAFLFSASKSPKSLFEKADPLYV